MTPEQLKDDEHITITLPKARAELLFRLLDAFAMIDGWCRVNKWIGKWVLIGALTAIVLLSDALNGIKNILASLGKH